MKNKNTRIPYGKNVYNQDEINAVLKTLKKSTQMGDAVNNFEKKLYTKDMPDPEILIRTGGAKRLSNFLLWQLAYSEIFFLDKLWPDFNEKDFNKILNSFYNIERKFGKIND